MSWLSSLTIGKNVKKYEIKMKYGIMNVTAEVN